MSVRVFEFLQELPDRFEILSLRLSKHGLEDRFGEHETVTTTTKKGEGEAWKATERARSDRGLADFIKAALIRGSSASSRESRTR